MTSRHGKAFFVTGLLWGEPTIASRFRSQSPVMCNLDVFFGVSLIKYTKKQLPVLWDAKTLITALKDWLLALCVGNSPVTGEIPKQTPVMRNFGIFFDLRLNKRLNKQSLGWWFETPSRSLRRHCNARIKNAVSVIIENLRIMPRINEIHHVLIITTTSICTFGNVLYSNKVFSVNGYV